MVKVSVKTIRFTGIVSVILLLITYAITVNIEVGFVRINSIWMSNNFALTACGGAFASMLVVLVCEIQKYFCVKRQTEDDLFRHMGLLWSYVAAMKKNINFCLSNPEQRITYGFLEGSCASIEHESNCSQEIEYYTMIHSKGLYEKQLVFKGFLSRYTVNIQNVHAHVSIAMNQDQIDNLQAYGVEKPITALSTRTNVALKESLCKIDSYLDVIDRQLVLLDETCKKRYQWELRREAILKDMPSIIMNVEQ